MIFVFVNMGPNGVKMLKRYSPYKCKLQPKIFKLVLKFPQNGPHKITMGIFKI